MPTFGAGPGRQPSRKAATGLAGYTFVEVVVAMVLLAIGLAGIYRVMIVSMQARQVAQNHYTATVMANNRIERAKNLAFGELDTLIENERSVNELGAPDVNGRYLRTTLIEETWNGEATLTRITVTIVPPSPNRRSDEGLPPVSVSTLLNNNLQP